MPGKTVAFFDPNANERGASVAIHQYADYNERILGNRSVIALPREAEGPSADMYRNRFPDTVAYGSVDDLGALSRQVDVFYMLTYGHVPPFDLAALKCRSAIHCALHGPQPARRRLRRRLRMGGRHLRHHRGPGRAPHRRPPGRRRGPAPGAEHSPEAVVFGRYGGFTQFNIMAVMRTIAHAVASREDLYFVFINTAPFMEHPRVIYLPKTVDPAYKARFINTCDAMIHARAEGETFGLRPSGSFRSAVNPSSAGSGRPIGSICMCWESTASTTGRRRSSSRRSCPSRRAETRPDCYSEKFSPHRVMGQFDRVFLA